MQLFTIDLRIETYTLLAACSTNPPV